MICIVDHINLRLIDELNFGLLLNYRSLNVEYYVLYIYYHSKTKRLTLKPINRFPLANALNNFTICINPFNDN